MRSSAFESEALRLGEKTYRLDEEGFLENPDEWDEGFAEAMATLTGIHKGLTPAHWEVIHYIRKTFRDSGKCPLVYEICRAHKLRLADLKGLFPSGYLRGACKVSGLTYKEEQAHQGWLPNRKAKRQKSLAEKVYRVDIRGFLVDPSEWDEGYAALRYLEMKMPGSLTDKHWRVIRFLRKKYQENGTVPTVYETCEANQLEIEDLERLFPDGYHRGAVKIAGLEAR
ncbi:MAG TPA: TusE/DsrC/DsvC family sulfur relay protein [Deltaproteobacteria bacterium]|jgi:tRNA 2-thiouridine synthesizing protein E|nr:TusE/DsrC/DsvC family sulfur relay protein [Deltaproteobacteria bacterium]